MSPNRFPQSPLPKTTLLPLVVLLASLLCGAEQTAFDTYAAALTWPERDETAKLSFSEERHFPFRRFPKRYSGAMYRTPTGELAIVYERGVRIVIRTEGLFIDEGDGRLRAAPMGATDAQAIGDLIRGDLDRLRNNWEAEKIDNGLRLRPRRESVREAIKRVDVTISEGRVSTVQVHQRNQAVRAYALGALTWLSPSEAAAPFAP